jgi:iron complex outermembrane receptor protein
MRDTIITCTIEPESIMLENITVHEHLDVDDRSGSFHVLTAKQLDRMRGMPFGEMLRSVPGVTALQTGPAVFKPIIHGLHSQRLLLLNNGIRHEGQQWGAEHAPEIDPFLAHDIVIIKDASALKYGAEALGGVILVNPAPLPETPAWGGVLHSTLQSNGRGGAMSAMLEGGSQRYKGMGWRAQLTARRLGDFQTPRYRLSNTGLSELNFSLAGALHREHQGLDIFFSHFNTEIGILKGTSISSLEDLSIAMMREPPQYTTSFTYRIQNPRQKVQHNLLKIHAHRHMMKGDVQLLYGFQYNSRKEFDLRRQSLNHLPALDLDLFTQTLDAGWQQHSGKKFRSEVGVNLMYQVNKNVPGTQRIPFIPNFTHLGVGGFYIGRLDLSGWILDAGLRYDFRNFSVSGFDFANRRFRAAYSLGNFSLSAGVKRIIDSDMVFTSHIGTAWRPPHVSELYSMGVHQTAAAIEYGLLLNRLTSEIINFHEGDFRNEQAVKWTNTWMVTRSRFRADITGYSNFIYNYIFLKPEGITRNIRGVYPYLRYHQTHAWFTGLDMFSEWNIFRHFYVTTKLSLLRAEDRTQRDVLIYIPSNRYEVLLSWNDQQEQKPVHFFAELSLRYTDRQRRAPRVITIREILQAYEQNEDPLQGRTEIFDFMPAPQGYFISSVEGGATFRLSPGKIDFRLRIENVFDRAYREYTNRLRYYALETGRNIAVIIKYSF